jgi:hypothetical protein
VDGDGGNQIAKKYSCKHCAHKNKNRGWDKSRKRNKDAFAKKKEKKGLRLESEKLQL